ncbi:MULTISPECIES: amidohydrolase family protein [unclassified Paraflavitalea]|uniref:amidohydrolase family protein n=1 Tax=unclassified Paraflavitalea TaxID=2798305 RepID=UPI003D351C63
MRKTILATLLLLFSISLIAQKKKALVGGTLIDGFGGEPLKNSVIIIEGEKIVKVGQVGSIEIPKDAEIISTEGMSVLPGLWDMHVHLMINGHSDYTYWDKKYPPLFRSVIMPAGAKQLLLAGVTSARDLGGPLEDVIGIRDDINRGKLDGPTLYVSGPFIQHAPYPGTEQFRWGVNGVEDARAKVQTLAKAGVDCIKLIDQDQMTMEEVMAVVDEAHKWKLKVVGHSHRPEEIRRGLKAGVDNFEHTGLATAPEYPEDIMNMIKERTGNSNNKLFWTPTIQGLWNYDYVRNNQEHLDDPSWKVGLPDSIVKDIRQSIAKPSQLSYNQLTAYRKPTLRRKFTQLKEAGLILMIGTDSGIPMTFHSQSTWNELDIWVRELGVDPMLAIRAATYWPAVFQGVDDKVGTVSEGKYADIIAVKGDVLRYIDLLQKVDLVIKHGKKVK